MSKAAAPIWSGSFFTASISPPSPDRRYTQEDFRIAQILQDEAPKKTFEDDSNDGIMGKVVEEITPPDSIPYKVKEELDANQVNQTFKKDLGFEPPYRPETPVKHIELTQPQKFVRVYDGVHSKMYGGWLMEAKEIEGLSPKEIQNKFALPYEPKYICDVSLPVGTCLRTGTANSLFGYEGGGIQYDLMGQFVGEFSNERLIGEN